MSYLPPYLYFKEKFRNVGANGKQRVQIDYDDFIGYLKLLLRGVELKEQWYLKQYPDVAAAITKGNYRSAKHHFVEEGYFEGRLPCELQIDEDWYVKTYPDVAAGILDGSFDSATQHFVTHGYAEGRLPSDHY